MKGRALTRRDVLRLGGLSAVIVGARGCGDNLGVHPPGTYHAAAMLEPESDSFVVTMWGAFARIGHIEVTDPDGAVVFATRVELRDEHASAVVSGLAASTSYQVTITTDDGVLLGPHQVRTAPLPDDPRPVRIAISADIDPAPEYISDLIAHMLAAEPELFISLGDFPYCDNGPIAQTEPEYRARYAEVQTEPRIRGLLEAVGVRAIYDDHEFRNDWDAEASAAEPQRYAAAIKVWDAFFPLPGSPDVRYRRWRWGAHVECFLLDCRRYRSPNAMPDGPDKTMLGATQYAWLIDGVTTSTATFKLVLTSVPLDFGDGDDHWAAFYDERNRMLDAFIGVPGVLFLTADQHLFAAHRHRNATREFQLGPLSRGIGVLTPESAGVLFRAPQMNFGLLDIDATSVTVTGVGVGGQEFYRETLGVADLTPRPPRR